MPATFNSENMISTNINSIFEQNYKFSVYPNPASGSFYLELESGNEKGREVLIYTMGGKEVYRNFVSDRIRISTGDWQPGIYLIVVGTETLKIVIQ